MSSYQRASYEQVHYTSNGGNARSDGYGGYRKAAGVAYANPSSPYSYGGGGYGYNGFDSGNKGGSVDLPLSGNMATSAQSWSSGYGNESVHYGGGDYSGRYGSTGGQMVAIGGRGSGQARIHQNWVQVQGMGAETIAEGCDLMSALVPTSFPPGTDPKFIDCFNRMDRDMNGSISDHELKSALSSFDQNFSFRTVHLLMFLFTGSNERDVTPKEFVPLVRSLQFWKACFEKHDRNKNGSLDQTELSQAMRSMNYPLSPFVMRLLVSKFNKSGIKGGIEYDYFIECCLIIRGLTEKFKCKEDPYTGTASFTVDEFLLNVIPFVVMN